MFTCILLLFYSITWHLMAFLFQKYFDSLKIAVPLIEFSSFKSLAFLLLVVPDIFGARSWFACSKFVSKWKNMLWLYISFMIRKISYISLHVQEMIYFSSPLVSKWIYLSMFMFSKQLFHLTFFQWTGGATLCFLSAKWVLQVWSHMQVRSSNTNSKI